MFFPSLNFIQNDYAKAGAGNVKDVENVKDVPHIHKSFLLIRLPLYLCSFFFTISIAKVLCTDFCSLHGLKKKKQIHTLVCMYLRMKMSMYPSCGEAVNRRHGITYDTWDDGGAL